MYSNTNVLAISYMEWRSRQNVHKHDIIENSQLAAESKRDKLHKYFRRPLFNCSVSSVVMQY